MQCRLITVIYVLLLFLHSTAIAEPEQRKLDYVARDKAAAELTDNDKRPIWSPNEPDPQTPAGKFFHRGYAFQKERRFSKAVQSYKHAVASDPRLMAAYYNMGRCFEEQEQWSQAETPFKKLIELEPKMPGPYKHMSFICFKEGKVLQAQSYLNTFRGL
ncbi:MAG TPA: tetratricopeptide repeat protein [Trichormus sp.]|jgi:tetratricopeptide (TPR) repeat protein